MNTLERALVEKAGQEHGWENVIESRDTGIVLASARHRAQVRISGLGEGAGWRVEVPNGLLTREVTRSFPDAHLEDGTFRAKSVDELALLLRRAAELAQSLPHQAAATYSARVKQALEAASATEVERLVRQRVGQETFREALMDYWGGACAVTGIDVAQVLRASHAKPWAECESDEERLDVFNGFLLCANLDALFDRGLITFNATGQLISSSRLSPRNRHDLGIQTNLALRWLSPEHETYLAWHRKNVVSQP